MGGVLEEEEEEEAPVVEGLEWPTVQLEVEAVAGRAAAMRVILPPRASKATAAVAAVAAVGVGRLRGSGKAPLPPRLKTR